MISRDGKPSGHRWRTAAWLVTGLSICTCLAITAVPTRPVPAASPLEVMHWLTSGRDAAALAVIKTRYVQSGGVWNDTPMPGAGETGRAAAVSRIMGGRPPGVFQFSLGAQLSELAAAELIRTFAPSAGWDGSIPTPIASLSKYNGRVLAVPVTIRGENWMFYNSAVLAKAGLTVPRTWPEFLASAEKLQAAGITPLALGGQSWQERLLFNAVLLGIGGRDFYRSVYERLDPRAIDSQTMLRVFETFGALRRYVDAGSPGRRWNQTTGMVIRGDAAFQVMGDWAKGEILAAGRQPGEEIGCALAPATEAAYIMMVDGFAFSATRDPALQASQDLFMRTLRESSVQVELARQLGSIPVRTDVANSDFDPCSAHAMTVVRNPDSQLMDPGLSLPGGLSGAIDDSISQFWNGRNLTAEQGRTAFRETIRTNR